MSGLLAFVGGMGAGYMSQSQRNRDNEREDKRDAMYAEKFGWERDKAAQEKQERDDEQTARGLIAEGAKAGTVSSDYSVDQIGADGKTYSQAQPSQGDAEFSAFMVNAANPAASTLPTEQGAKSPIPLRSADSLNTTPAAKPSAPAAPIAESPLSLKSASSLGAPQAATPSAPSANESSDAPTASVKQSGFSYTGADGAKKSFTGLKEAQDYADKNPISEHQRMSAIAQKMRATPGLYKRSIQMQADAVALENAGLERDERHEKLKTEGAYKALAMFQMGNIKGGFAAYNSSGDERLDEETTKITPLTFNAPGYGEVKTFKIEGNLIDKNGNKTAISTNGWDLGNALAPYKEQRTALLEAIKLERDGKKVDQEIAASKDHGNYYRASANNLNSKASGAAASAGDATTYGAKDIRDMQSDYFTLNSPKQTDVTEKPEVFAAKQAAFNKDQIDALGLFRMNGERGNVLHAAELREAQNIMAAAKTNPALIHHATDAKTNTVSHFVNVGGRSVLVGRSQAKTPAGK